MTKDVDVIYRRNVVWNMIAGVINAAEAVIDFAVRGYKACVE